MLKTILLLLLIVSAAARAGDLTFLLVTGATNLPPAVIITTALMVLYALILIMKRIFSGNVTLRQFMAFYVMQGLVTVFNLAFTTISSPLQVTWLEAFAIGTLFDVLVDVLAVYFIQKQIRSHYLAVAPPDLRNRKS